MSDKQVSVRIAVLDGKKAKAELVGFGREGAAAIQQVDKAGMNTHGIQNFSYQMNDLFVQVNGGTDVMRALGQQLPQMLQGFGLFGAVAAVAAAGMEPLVSLLFSAEEKAVSLEDAISGLEKAQRAYLQSVTDARAPLAALRDLYGENAEKAQQLQKIQMVIARADYAKALKTARQSVGDNLSGLTDILGEIGGYRTDMGQAGAFDLQAQEAIITAQQELQKEYGYTEEQALRVKAALDGWASAKSPAEMAAAANDLALALADGSAGASEMSDKVAAAAQAAAEAALEGMSLAEALQAGEDAAGGLASTDIAGGISAASAEALLLAERLNIALSTAARLAAMGDQGIEVYQGPISSGRGGDPRSMGGSADDYRYYEADRWLKQWAEDQKKLRGGRKGGGGGASKAKNDAEREAERVYAATRTEAEKYAIELKKLNKLQADGQISADTYARAVAQAQEALAKSDETAKFWRDGMDDLNNGILDAITNGGSLSDVLGDVGKALERAAWEAALFGTGPMAKGGGFSLLGGLGDWVSGLMSFDGGGHTGNGARSGGLDGRGGFLAIMHPRERVDDLTRPQSGAGAGALQISLGDGLQAEWLGKSGLQARIISQEASARQARGLPAAMRHMQARGTAS